MDVAMISHTISNILQWMNSLDPKENGLTGIYINHLENNLTQINEKVQQGSHFGWLQKVKDVVMKLSYLMEDFHSKRSTNGSTKSLIRSSLSLKKRIKAILLVKKATQELKRLIEIQEKGEEAVISDTNVGRYFLSKVSEKIPVFGRKNEKEEIIDQLLNLNKNNSDVFTVVIVIVGVCGLGKTKLARHVCKDRQVKARFQPIWINNSDVESIANCVTESRHEKDVLLVIDDLQIANDDLDKLQKKLTEAVGSRTDMAILVTTRSNKVAKKIVARHVLRLQRLNEEESWSLFQHIHGPITSTKKELTTTEPEPEPEREDVRDCGGVPLLIVIIATVMKHHGGGRDEWTLEALQTLKIIYYNDLPNCKKLCFAYCSLFLDDYLIDAEKLIQLWTAEGFLHNTIASDSGTITAKQQFDRACFDDFVPLVFHQAELENDHHKYCGVVRNNDLYSMNKLMHKLAKLVSADGENIISDSTGSRVHGGMLRVSFNCTLDLSREMPNSMFEKAKKLTTILFPYNPNNPRLPHEVKMTASTCNKIFNTFKHSLHTLDLRDLGIKMVPRSIEEVKYLRYLNLSHNNMEKLPSCITTLAHLQTLKLSQCHVLKKLPKHMGNLSSLNHLDIEGCLRLTHMPSGIRKLTDLQTLSLFVANKKHVSGGLRSLTNLNKLRGYLEISHLEQVKFCPSKEDAKDEFLKNKQNLEFMTLRWYHKEDDKKKKRNFKDKVSLDFLEPHQNLKVLHVVGYNGTTLSNWLASLRHLVKFTLNNCPKCQFLPSMDKLPFLKVLQLWRLDSMEFITVTESNQVGSSTPIFFPSLKELTILDCPNLKSWWEDEKREKDIPSFSCISKLNIQYCPQLACMPLYPGLDEELVLVESNVKSMTNTMQYVDSTECIETSNSKSQPFSKLKSMVLEGIEESPLESSWLKNFISLKELHIRDCSNMKSLPQGFEFLSSLQSLSIERCEELVLDADITKAELEGLKNLTSLTLRAIPKLKYLPCGIEWLQCLKDLRIYDCHGLTHLPDSISNLASLRQLVISECRLLQSLPKGMAMMISLRTLNIKNCPLLLPRCQPDTGDDWPQIAHIKNITVKQTSQEGM